MEVGKHLGQGSPVEGSCLLDTGRVMAGTMVLVMVISADFHAAPPLRQLRLSAGILVMFRLSSNLDT